MYDTNNIPQQKSTIKKHRSHSEWRGLVAEQEKSNLSVAAFCQQHQLTESGFYAWRKKFALSEQAFSSDAMIELTDPPSVTDQKGKLSNSHWQVELELGSGCILRIHSHSF